MIGVDPDTLFIPAMTEPHNSENSTHEQDEQRETPERLEADHNMYTTANGSNPSREQESNPSRGIEDTMEDLRSKLYEAQATNETFRSQNVELNRRISRIARENQEHRQQQLA